MSIPGYPKYKDSGVEWLAEVPEHWRTERVRRLCAIKKRVAGRLGYDVLSITQDGIKIKDILSNHGQLSMDYSKYQLVDVGDFAMNHMDLLTGWVDISQVAGVTSPDYRVFAVTDERVSQPRYLLYVFQMGYRNRILFAYGQGSSHLGRWRLPTQEFNALVLPVPPLEEQQAIVTYLDSETAKIDALIAEQMRLIELLQEKRLAVISHAVTKGLDADVPMRPSGIDWLGSVPTHWEVQPLKRLVCTPITDGPHETPQFLDEGVPFVSAEAVSSGQIDFAKVRAFISEEDNLRYSAKYSPKLHDIYMVKSGATTGTTAIVDDRTDFNIWSPLAAIRCGDRVNPWFVLSFMRSRHFLEGVTLAWNFGTQQNIGMGVIENLACPVPPLPEQLSIIEHLREQTIAYEALTTDALRAIALLKERRTALISAAVTGKIDVRGYAAAEAA